MHLFVVGPPGIGKSTVAPVLARHFGASVFELDREIQRRAGKPNKDFIEQDGIDRFREVESSVLTGLAATPSWVVVDTGGGAPIRKENRALMRSLGLIIGLRGSLDRVASGIAATQEKRPYQNVAPRDRARQVLRERKAAYADTDVTFDVDGATSEETARAIAAWLVSARGVRIDVAGPEQPCRVLIRAGLLEHVGPHLADLGWRGQVAVVSDAPTAARYEPDLQRSLASVGLKAVTLRVPAGERGKQLRIAAQLWASLASSRIGRDGGIIALGGGSVGDVAGFVAATYLRGIRLAQVPTTLLGMADASIGGKTAIDIAAGKNLVGAFHSPDAVFADLAVLATLPARQLSSGLAEVTKCAFLADRESVQQLARSLENVRAGDLGAVLAAVTIAAEVKAGIVSQDPRESGLRELLNFGHTMGHAYEAASSYRVTHGEAVAVGMVYATALAERLELTTPNVRPELENLLDRAALPTRARLPKGVWDFVLQDKKARGGKLRWILPRRIGQFSEVTDVGEPALRAAARVVERAA
ncbi:MAG: 3-dehydroquinate synthase [Chloroflexi bacterium]|nr:MAG: 3-dehydroquinate synthase [Chloroflexota bacterium]